MINIISGMDDSEGMESIRRWNQVIAWSLHTAFDKLEYENRLVKYTNNNVPKADHVIGISQFSPKLKDCAYREMVRGATRGKITIYMDWDIPLAYPFDIVFTAIPPRENARRKFVYAGWGALHQYFYPDQRENERTIYFDLLPPTRVVQMKKNAQLNDIYQTIQKVLSDIDAKVYIANDHEWRWLEMQEVLKKCHFHIEMIHKLQGNNCGLTRIEAATCGALLVVPKLKYLSSERTLKPLAHKLWGTESELRSILESKTDPIAISKQAKKQNWVAAANRIIKALEEKKE